MTDTIPLLIMYLFYSFQLFGSSPFFSHLGYRPASPPSRRTYVHVVEVCFSITQSKAYFYLFSFSREELLHSESQIYR